jgi:hypothetical protein
MPNFGGSTASPSIAGCGVSYVFQFEGIEAKHNSMHESFWVPAIVATLSGIHFRNELFLHKFPLVAFPDYSSPAEA